MMRALRPLLILVSCSVLSSSVEGQGPGGPGVSAGVLMRGPGGSRGAEFLLGHVGELQLTDAQVVRLAAIARRADGRRRGFQVTMDSMRSRMTPPRPDSVRPRQRALPPEFDAARRGMEQMREQDHADLRDAITVLTPDQQAIAWEMVGSGGPGGPGPFRVEPGPGGPGMRMRMGGPEGPRSPAPPRRPGD